MPNASESFATGRTDQNGRVTFQVSGPVPSQVDVYGSVRDEGKTMSWNVKGATAVRYDNGGGYHWAVLDLKAVMKTMNNMVDDGMSDSAFEDDPMFQMAKGVINTSFNTIEVAWGIPVSVKFGTTAIYPDDPNFTSDVSSTTNSDVDADVNVNMNINMNATADVDASSAVPPPAPVEDRQAEDDLGLFAGTYTVSFQSKSIKVPFNIYINGELATSYAATTHRIKVDVDKDLMTDIRIEFEDGSVPAITRRAPIGAKDVDGNIIETYAYTIKKKKNGKVVLNRRLMYPRSWYKVYKSQWSVFSDGCGLFFELL